MEKFSQDFILLVTSLSGVGISYLVGLLWKHHKSRIDSLSLLTYKNIDSELEAFERTTDKMDKHLKGKIDVLIKKREGKDESKLNTQKLEILNNIINQSMHMYYMEGTQSKYANKLYADIKKIAGNEPESLRLKLENMINEIKNNK